MLGQSISKNAVLLGLFAVITTATIAGTFLSTQATIKENIRAAEARALLEIMPASSHDNSLLDDSYPIGDSEYLGLREEKKLYIARVNHNPIGVILPVTARDGYTGDIDMIVGIWKSGQIAGVRVLAHRETPGLGDAIDRKKSLWVDGFINKSLLNPEESQWGVKKDGGLFDQFTGATITPRAVTQAVKRSLMFYEENKQSLLDLTPSGHDTE